MMERECNWKYGIYSVEVAYVEELVFWISGLLEFIKIKGLCDKLL